MPITTDHSLEQSWLKRITNTQWTRLGALKNLKMLLIISGIEINPGPVKTSTISISHVNINSITSENKIDELSQFVLANEIKILAVTETKLDNSIDCDLYKLDDYHRPLTKHRTRHGGGVALYIHSSLPVQRLQHLEVGNNEWIWAKIKLKLFTTAISSK